MNEFIAIIAGVFLAAMASMNGLLSNYLNIFEVSFVVHIIGMLLLIVYIIFVKKQALKITGAPIILYSVGLLGIFLVAFTSFCFTQIGATATIALSIAGQIAASAIIDYFGFFGIKKTPFYSKRILSLSIICIGLMMII